jgi:hypothetical protein
MSVAPVVQAELTGYTASLAAKPAQSDNHFIG